MLPHNLHSEHSSPNAAILPGYNSFLLCSIERANQIQEAIMAKRKYGPPTKRKRKNDRKWAVKRAKQMLFGAKPKKQRRRRRRR